VAHNAIEILSELRVYSGDFQDERDVFLQKYLEQIFTLAFDCVQFSDEDEKSQMENKGDDVYLGSAD